MRFRLATSADDEPLRRLQAQCAMPGPVQVAYEREPSFFLGAAVTGAPLQVLVAEDQEGLAGFGCRSVRRLFVNGRPQAVGYLGSLKLAPRARGGTTLARGYRFLGELHEQAGDVPYYITTIVEGNDVALQTLTGSRAGLPVYRPLGVYETSALWLPRRATAAASSLAAAGAMEVRRGGVPLAELVAFLQRHGAGRQFFPVTDEAELSTPLWHGLRPEDFLVLTARNRIVGTLALWDQSAFRQYRIRRYAPALRTVRPVLNLLLAAAGKCGMPPAGDALRLACLTLPCLVEPRPEHLRLLLDAAVRQAAEAGGYHALVIGFHERDPLRAALYGLPRSDYRSRLYLVYWPDGAAAVDALDPRPVPYLELGCL